MYVPEHWTIPKHPVPAIQKFCTVQDVGGWLSTYHIVYFHHSTRVGFQKIRFFFYFLQVLLRSRQSEFLAAVCGRWLCESQRMGFCIYKSQMLKRPVMMSMGFRQWQTKYLIIYFLQIRSGFACDISWPVSFWTDSQQLVFVWQLLWTSISPQLNRSHCGPCSQSCIVCLPLFNRSASCVKHLRAIVEFSSKKQITIIYWDKIVCPSWMFIIDGKLTHCTNISPEEQVRMNENLSTSQPPLARVVFCC